LGCYNQPNMNKQLNRSLLATIAIALTAAVLFFNFQNKPQTMLPVNNENYEAEWKEIDSLDQQRLPKSALEKVETLLERARKEDNAPQVIKALIYRGKYQSQLEEDGLVKAIYRMEEEIEQADFPEKSLLESMLAEMYQQYLNNNRWKFQNRTTPVDFQSEDIRTWTIEQLIDKSGALYLASLEEKRTARMKIEDFSAILSKGRNVLGLRPTLYDFLAHRAINYFSNDQAYLTQPANQFQVDNPAYFELAQDFAQLKLEAEDSTAFKFKTLQVFQQLLTAQQEKLKPLGFVSPETEKPIVVADLQRLKWVYDHSVLENKEELYLGALSRWINGAHGENQAEVWYAIAQFWQQKAAKTFILDEEKKRELTLRDLLIIDKENPTNQWDYAKAVMACEEGKKKFPDSFSGQNCKALQKQIEGRSLNLRMEKVSLPDQSILVLTEYKNVKKAYLKVIRMNEQRRADFEKAQQQERRRNNDQVLNYFNSLPAVQQNSFELPAIGDYRKHSTELPLDAIPLGHYCVMIANNPKFTKTVGAAGYAFVNVSELGHWYRRNNVGADEFTVFHRKTGQPIEGVEAYFSTINYNANSRRDEISKNAKKVVSDESGFFTKPDLPKPNKRSGNNYSLLLKKGADSLFLDERYYSYNYNNTNRSYQTTHFFLDRAIYRPGQTVYFKGIAIETDPERMPNILANKKVVVTFRDANYQEVAKLDLQTNEYGTFNGNFTAPQGGLLGQMQLQSSIGGSSKVLRVEEYKRPKFEVTFEPIKGSFKLDETVNVTGQAKAFAGSNIDGATVKYRVVRQVRFPWLPRWYWGWRANPWSSNSQQIAIGEAVTDAEGKFKIEFTALPDRSVPKDKKPEFIYTVSADVVDITGETRSATKQVKVGTIALRANVPLEGQVNTDSLKKLTISTENLNGEFEAATGTILIEKLNPPNQIFSFRSWQEPDHHLLSKEEFKKAFPHLPFKEEEKYRNWPVQRTVLEAEFDTEKSKELLLPKSKINAGVYALTLKTQDKFGTAVEKKQFFQVYDLGNKKMPYPMTHWHLQEKESFEPKETANIWFGSGLPAQPILFEVERDGKILYRKWLTVSQLNKENYTIQEQDRGNVYYHYNLAWENKSYNAAKTLNVPWSNKDLTFEYSTFRNKLQPGQEEEWTIKVKGPKGEKVAAEMVAALYDASLDEFAKNHWSMNLFPTNRMEKKWSPKGFSTVSPRFYQNWNRNIPKQRRQFQQLNWFGFRFYDNGGGIALGGRAAGVEIMEESSPNIQLRGNAKMRKSSAPAPAAAGGMAEDAVAYSSTADLPQKTVNATAAQTAGLSSESDDNDGGNTDFSQIKVRTNLDETVFFMPNLMTDKDGNVLLKFTMNEALTKWKFLGLAHTKDLKFGTTTNEIVTQKELMVVPNAPRFFREKDEIEYTAKVVNLSDKKLTGNAQLQLVNPIDALPIYKWENKPDFNRNFIVEAGQSTLLAWRFTIPNIDEVPLIEHTVLAQADDFSDAERSTAPVLSNRMLVTETLPLPVRENSTETYTLQSLQNNESSSLTHHQLALEFTSNPAWYAVQALPYLMEYPYDCTEQIFSRYYANTLASHVANSTPKIKSIFDRWRAYEPDALLSNLSKNQELKSALLEETPWVMAAKNEEQQKKNIALLFDLNKMSHEQAVAFRKLKEQQLSNGGWSWFPGGRDSWYITQYLVEGFGHLDALGVADVTKNQGTWQMVQNAVRYIDSRMIERYERLEKLVQEGKTTWEKEHLNNLDIHYLYARSFFLQQNSVQANKKSTNDGKQQKFIALKGKSQKVFDYFLSQAEEYWNKRGLYQNGLIALAAHRVANTKTADDIVKSLKERSLNNAELGMYWKYNTGYYWYQLPIETHALMIEVFDEVVQDAKAVNDLKVWLLKNKQTNHWKTTKATAAASYALLATGANWLDESAPVSINFEGNKANELNQQIKKAQQSAEAGTGYFKTQIEGDAIDKSLATVTVSNPNPHPAWGALYWQYFEDLDKINTFEETLLTIKKQLFLVNMGDTGEELQQLDNSTLKPGDKLNVRIELRVDRDMEYVHMKDMRAAGFEPINVLSRYKWQDGLGYYESTRDASTNFFFSRLPKGTYVFEYPLRVQLAGDFSNGVTTVQCMYAPEFSGHSEGDRVRVVRE